MTRLPKRAREQKDSSGRTGRLPPQLSALFQDECAEAENNTGEEQELPVELLAALFGLRYHGRDSPAANAFDDPECDVAIGYTTDLEVLAAAGRGDLAKRVAIEDRMHRRGRRRPVGARRLRNHPAAHGPDADDVDGDLPPPRIRQRDGDVAAPRL